MYIQPLGELFRARLAVVLDMAVSRIAVEALQVQEGRYIGMGGGAVVAFVEVVGCDFPVV
jgi:hypothetical protein